MEEATLVHVIGPEPGQRFERTFPAGWSDAVILRQLEGVKATFGRAARIVKKDKDTGHPAAFPDHASPWLYDLPATRVVVGRDDAGDFVEIRTIRGPAPAPADTPVVVSNP